MEGHAAAVLRRDSGNGFACNPAPEKEAIGTAIGLFDALELAVLLCDRAGLILAASAPAEMLLAEGHAFRARFGRLVAAGCERALLDAVAKAADVFGSLRPVASSLNVGAGTQCWRVDVRPYAARRGGFVPAAFALVAIFERRPPSVAALQQLGLSASEAAVARRLLEGISPADIAEERRVGITTVRSQIRSCYEKLNVHSLGELCSTLRHRI